MIKTKMFNWKRADIINEENPPSSMKSLSLSPLFSTFIKQPTPPQRYIDLQSELIWHMDELSPKRGYLFIGCNPCQLFPFNIPLNVGWWNGVGGGGGRIKYSCSDGWRFIDQRLNPNPYVPLSRTWSWHVRIRWKVTVRGGKLLLLQNALKICFFRTEILLIYIIKFLRP